MSDTFEQSDAAKREEEILAFWEDQKIFEKTLQKPSLKGDFVFYDGPPFATGLPHHGHILATTIKDVIPRYRTMRGYHVRRRWGWDCHGLPLENIIEKELGIRTKRDIEEMGVAKFNQAAKNAVLRYADEWRRIIPRIGRWVDMNDDYKTMDSSYTESVWWAFKSLHDKGLIEEGFKVMQLCPRCGTTLSNFEVSQGYKDIKDLTAVAKFECKEEPGTYLLAWTTTPWTLPGNVALAVGRDIDYVKWTEDGSSYIAARNFFESRGLTVPVESVSVDSLIERSYTPLFPGVADTLAEGKERDKLGGAFRVYPADFVTTEEGTGIVHVAPAFGEEDLGLARTYNLPVIHHVDRDGRMVAAVPAVAGKLAKPKGNWKETDTEIVSYLGDAVYLAEEKEHSYPHCWRCDTPLLNYASTSWFVTVSGFRDRLVSENAKINWVPGAIGQNRFGDWLKNARDWAISRSRYWGAPIPVWKNERTGALRVIGSLGELKKYARTSANEYIIMRHGEAESNAHNLLDSTDEKKWPLTERGREQVKQNAEKLKGSGITKIIASPFARTRESAAIIAETLGFDSSAVVFDDRAREFNFGDLSGTSHTEYMERRKSMTYDECVPGGGSYQDAKTRFGDLLYSLEREYSGETILLVSHGIAIEALQAVALAETAEESMKAARTFIPHCGETLKLDFVPLPHNEKYELDLHRPYIDELMLVDDDGAALHRVTDVFDCWFESGSMSYAQDHYPFEKNNFDPNPGWLKKSKGYPADFIAEGLDQTRGWFYSLLVLGVSLFGRSPYKNVIVNGLILAEDGRKMSKKLKNYPEPMEIVERYGADALRFYLLSSPLLRGEDLRFSERGVAEVGNKVLGRLHNMLVFYQTYAPKDVPERKESSELLDRWVLSRLSETKSEVVNALERYELDRATRPIADFIDDLSTWYLRRSRERIRSSADAAATLRYILRETAIVLAPFMPFYAEYLYGAVKYTNDFESVHLEAWPETGAYDIALTASMKSMRALASEALMLRQKANIKVRQPLAALSIPGDLSPELQELLKDEVNVKEIRTNAPETALDTELTPELVREGDVREFARALADARKEAGFSAMDTVAVQASGNAKETLSNATLTGVKGITFNAAPDAPYSVDISSGKIQFSIAHAA